MRSERSERQREHRDDERVALGQRLENAAVDPQRGRDLISDERLLDVARERGTSDRAVRRLGGVIGLHRGSRFENEAPAQPARA